MTRGMMAPNSAQTEPAAPHMTPRTMTNSEVNKLMDITSAARNEKHGTSTVSHCRISTWRHAAGASPLALSSLEASQAWAQVQSASYVGTSPSAMLPASRRMVSDIFQTPISNSEVSCWVSMLASPSPFHQSKELAMMDR